MCTFLSPGSDLGRLLRGRDGHVMSVFTQDHTHSFSCVEITIFNCVETNTKLKTTIL